MTDDTPVDIDTDDLAAFEAEFYEQPKVKAEAEPEDDVEAEDEPEVEDHPEDDENDPLEPEDEAEADATEEDESEEDDEPKGKTRKSAKERINELTADKHEERRLRIAAEKREAQLTARLEKLEAAVGEKPEKTPPALRDILSADAPSPDALDDDGEPVYALGEFDPKFIRDLTRFTIKQENEVAAKDREQKEITAKIESDREEIKTVWADKLEKYEADVPEIREKIAELTETFQSVEPAYGEYLATTLMTSEYGVQIMDYLSDNIGEAQRIVASGPAAATLALGRLEARFVKASSPEDKPKQQNKVSEAKTPPETSNKGRGAKFAVPIDTDDLDAFEREFYKR